MTRYLKIKKWEEFQHYKDRNPPWIKLATDLFQDYDFSRLQDASKLLAVCIWTLGSRSKDGTIPYDFDYIKSQSCLGTLVKPEHLQELINKGFLIDASNMLAECLQDASPETEGEAYRKETETETEGDIYAETFETFWRDYPKQRAGSSKKADAALRQALKRATAEEILAGLARYAISDEVAKGFAKGAAAWLNDDRWNSDYTKRTENETTGRSGTNGNSGTGYPKQPTKHERLEAVIRSERERLNLPQG